MSGKEYVYREQHERVVAAYQKALQDLNAAQVLINHLKGGPLSVSTVEVGGALEPKKSIGVVQCPRCKQWMEIEA